MADEPNAWHLDKKVSVGHLVSTLILAVGFISYISKQDTRIGLLEQRLQIEIDRAEKADLEAKHDREALRQEGKAERRELANSIKEQLNRINAKLDTLIEGRK